MLVESFPHLTTGEVRGLARLFMTWDDECARLPARLPASHIARCRQPAPLSLLSCADTSWPAVEQSVNQSVY